MVTLRNGEAKLLRQLASMNGKVSMKPLLDETGLGISALMRSALELSKRGLIRHEKVSVKGLILTSEGKIYAEKGLPEEQAVRVLKGLGGRAPVKKVLEELELPLKLTPVILGWLKRKNLAIIERRGEEIVLELQKGRRRTEDTALLEILLQEGEVDLKRLSKSLREAASTLKKRGLLSGLMKTDWIFELTEKGLKFAEKGIEVSEEVSQLAPDQIARGDWRNLKLRRYNITAPVTVNWPGKRQPYNSFLDELKLKLVALGFKEMEGPIIESMFFNCDALFMPQDHPARDIHDIFFLKTPEYCRGEDFQKYIEQVKETHENGWKTGSTGWGYTYSIDLSRRLILRSHGTAISARTLVDKNLQIPGKYFSIARCYRPEITDRTHLTEFNQVEGIVVAENLTLRDLLGVLKKFALDLAGADDVKFKPDYFPFTEPSVEMMAYKKGYGWLEFGGSGIFRPELTLPLGIETPVLAWGLGVDRLYMMKSDITDIRDLFTSDLDWLRTRRID